MHKAPDRDMHAPGRKLSSQIALEGVDDNSAVADGQVAGDHHLIAGKTQNQENNNNNNSEPGTDGTKSDHKASATQTDQMANALAKTGASEDTQMSAVTVGAGSFRSSGESAHKINISKSRMSLYQPEVSSAFFSRKGGLVKSALFKKPEMRTEEELTALSK
jgi:hypothetical protein